MEEEQHWKQFQGTELGSLMTQLYGSKPKIDYPKPSSSKKAPPPAGNFISGGSVDAVDPRKSTRRKVDVATPKFGSAKSSSSSLAAAGVAAVECVPRRKNETAIRSELEDIRMRQSHYRPAFVAPISSDAEKDRLSQICTYKGGKALPQSCVLPVSEAPFEIAAKEKQLKLQEQHRARRGLSNTKNSGAARQPLAEISLDEQMAMQISKEIDERREYLEEMGDSLPESKRVIIRNEITQRISELRKIDG